MSADALCKELLLADHHVLIAKHKARLRWMAVFRRNTLLEGILGYDEKFGKCPPGKEALLDFVTKYGAELGIIGKSSEGLASLIDAALEIPEGAYTRDVEQLIDAAFTTADEDFVVEAHHRAAKIIVAGVTHKDRLIKGIPVAESFFTKRMSKRLVENNTGLWLHENTEQIKEDLRKDYTKDRILTGFNSLDREIILSKKMNPLWVIPGFAHEGKSTILTAILYNLLSRQPGLKIAYFSGEHDARLDLLPKLAFIHAYKFKKNYNWVLPSMNDWFAGRRTAEDELRMNQIIDDVLSLPGKIVLYGLPPWDEIQGILASDKFDVCAVDYLAIIPMPGIKEQYKRDEVRRLVAEAHALAQTYNGGEGLIFITPAQINRQGKKDSLKKEEGQKKYDLTAISQYSELYQDADFVFSLFSDDDMKAQSMWQLEVLKVRALRPQWYPVAYLKQDYSSGHVREVIGTAGAESPIKQAWHAETEQKKLDKLDLVAEELKF